MNSYTIHGLKLFPLMLKKNVCILCNSSSLRDMFLLSLNTFLFSSYVSIRHVTRVNQITHEG